MSYAYLFEHLLKRQTFYIVPILGILCFALTDNFPGKMSDSKYFNTQKKGEIYELKAELNSDKKEKKKEAVKKV